MFSLTTLQSGKSLGKNTIEFTAIGTLGEYSQNSHSDKEGDFDSKALFTARGKIGITEDFDSDVQLDQASTIGANIKYQLLNLTLILRKASLIERKKPQ